MDDRYIGLLVGNPPKHLPLINRGTYLRTTVLDQMIIEFAGSYQPCQVISLGAGWDTRYFKLIDQGIETFQYFEVDFDLVLAKKERRLGKYMKANLHLVKANLGLFATQVVPLLVSRGFRPNLPTLVVSEMVLVYLDAKNGDEIIQWFSTTLDKVRGPHMFVVFEPCNIFDSFGMQMTRRLVDCGVRLNSLVSYPDAESQIQRFRRLGWPQVSTFNMLDAYKTRISENERQRVEALEIVDEVEEWEMLCSHYNFVVARRDKADPSENKNNLWYPMKELELHKGCAALHFTSLLCTQAELYFQGCMLRSNPSGIELLHFFGYLFMSLSLLHGEKAFLQIFIGVSVFIYMWNSIRLGLEDYLDQHRYFIVQGILFASKIIWLSLIFIRTSPCFSKTHFFKSAWDLQKMSSLGIAVQIFSAILRASYCFPLFVESFGSYAFNSAIYWLIGLCFENKAPPSSPEKRLVETLFLVIQLLNSGQFSSTLVHLRASSEWKVLALIFSVTFIYNVTVLYSLTMLFNWKQ